MSVKETTESGRTIHDYTEEPISDGRLHSLLNRVKYTPTGYNLQPHEFLVLQDDQKETLRQCAYDQDQVTDAAAAIVVLGNLDPAAHASSIFDDWLAKGHIPNNGVREKLLETVEGWRERSETENRIWTVRNTSLAALTLIYAAWDMGIASSPMEGFDADAVRESFDISDEYEPVMVITLGYAAETDWDQSKAHKSRRQPAEMAHFGEFEPEAE